MLEIIRSIFGKRKSASSSNETPPRKTPQRRTKQQLNLGIDFGTAFTKVVVGESRVRYAVPFEDPPIDINTYLLPGKLTISADGTCHIGRQDQTDTSQVVTELKIRLLERNFDNNSQTYACAFLALVIRHAVSWLLNTHRNTYIDKDLDWFINVGVPTESWHDTELTDCYQKITSAAWALANSKLPVTLEIASDAVFDPNKHSEITSNEIHFEKIGTHPEFAAQIAGYVRSPRRRSDLHVLVDIGAGTLDTSVFNIWEHEGDDLYPIFAKSVDLLGVDYLYRHRKDWSNYNGHWTFDHFSAPPSDDELVSILGISKEQLGEIDKQFAEKIREGLFGLLRYTKSKRYPDSPRWNDGVPLFLCGGGSRVSFYSSLYNAISNQSKKFRLRVEKLPKPDTLEANHVDELDFDRLSVAYGLSFNALDLGQIRPESEIDDVSDTDTREPTSSSVANKVLCDICSGTGGAYGPNCYKCGGTGWVSQ